MALAIIVVVDIVATMLQISFFLGICITCNSFAAAILRFQKKKSTVSINANVDYFNPDKLLHPVRCQ